MAYRQYIGSRYVPIFGRKGENTYEWDNSAPYEPLTVVMHQGNSFTSVQYVPTGIDINNHNYWAETGNYNAQVEQYRQEVRTFDNRITENTNGIAELSEHVSEEFEAESNRITANANGLAELSEHVSEESNRITANTTGLAELSEHVSEEFEAESNRITTLENKFPIGTADIANGVVSTEKLTSNTIIRFRDKYQSIAGTNLVVFGDSYTQDNIANSINAYWPKRLNGTLGTTLYNYAIAGAGFGRETQLISRQQTNCAETMSTDEAKNTSIVICMAGCNDLLNDIALSSINAGITNFIKWSNSFFPNADIYVIPYNWGFAKLSNKLNALITNSMNSIMTYNVKRVHIIPYAWTWNLGIASRFQNEVHPNMSGYNQICARILDAINGRNTAAFNSGNTLDLSNASGLNSGYLEYICREGTVYVNGYVRPTNSGAQNITIYGENKLPAILTPNNSLFVLGLSDSTNHDYAGVINFANNGRLLVNLNSRVGANDVCCFNGAFVPEVGVDWNDYV